MQRISHFGCAVAVLVLASCEQSSDDTGRDVPPAESVVEYSDVIASDELPGIATQASGVDFWTHPNVAFNSMMIVADGDGLAAYNIEDGNSVSRAPGAFQGIEVSYFGFGPSAAGIVVTLDTEASGIQFFGVDNASRLFLPLSGGPVIRGSVRDFCIGRADGSPAPTLFVVQRERISIFNLQIDQDSDTSGIIASVPTQLDIPDDITRCTVDNTGVLVLGSDTGAIYRLTDETSFASPFAETGNTDMTALEFVGGATPQMIAVLDGVSGSVHLIDSENGGARGAVRIVANVNIDAVESATTLGATLANLGGLYRNGIIALGVAGDASAIRLAPFNGVTNALNLTITPTTGPRGALPDLEPDLTLDFNTSAPLAPAESTD